MSVSAVLKLAPVLTLENLDELQRRGRDTFDAGALKNINRAARCPVLVDHDESRQIGHVDEFATWPDTGGLWTWAHCTIADPPDWLRTGTAVSFGYATLSAGDFQGLKRIYRAAATEVSILPPSVKGYEPLARVAMVGEARPDLPAVGTSDRLAAGEVVIYGNGQLIRRYYDTTFTIR